MAKSAAERQAESRARRKQSGMVVLQLPLTAIEHRRLKAKAKKAGLSINAMAREAIASLQKQRSPGV